MDELVKRKRKMQKFQMYTDYLLMMNNVIDSDCLGIDKPHWLDDVARGVTNCTKITSAKSITNQRSPIKLLLRSAIFDPTLTKKDHRSSIIDPLFTKVLLRTSTISNQRN